MRIFTLSILSMAAISIASAGQIEIGAGLSSGISSGGLNSSYLNGAVVGSNNFSGDASPSDTWAEKSYASNLFKNDVISNSSLGGSTLPDSSSQQFTDPNNSVVFAMDSDSGSNFWASGIGSTTGSSSITIPVGVYSVGSAYILLNDYYGVGNTDSVTFNFANYGAYTVNLTNGNQIDSASDCPVASPTDTTVPLCTAYATSTTSPNTDKAWTANYSNTFTDTTNPYSNTAGTSANPGLGTVNLADIYFNLSGVTNFQTDTLTSITVTDNNNCAPGGCPSITSRLALSAITVEQTPEPSTVLLFTGGLGIMGFVAKRRKVRR